jgi:tRNA1Val (adenine37-N6)-methyltransferase
MEYGKSFDVEPLTTDSFFDGRIRIKQHRCGYRFSIDAVILAHHADPKPGDRVVDLGTGCGIVPLILTYRHPDLHVYGIEVQAELAAISERNILDNHMDDRISILHEDMNTLNINMISGPVDLVISNPPYRKANSGRINPDRQRAVARHEIRATLNDVIQTARRILRPFGHFLTIYTADRMTDLFTQLRSASLEPKFLRTIHSALNSEAKLILVEALKGGGPGIKIGPSFIIYQADGSYTAEVESMFAP